MQILNEEKKAMVFFFENVCITEHYYDSFIQELLQWSILIQMCLKLSLETYILLCISFSDQILDKLVFDNINSW